MELQSGSRSRTRRTSLARALALGALALVVSGCGYNTLVSEQEAVDGAWSEVENQLQRRNDLVPNLVATVKGFAAQEKEVLTRVTEARSRIGGGQSREQQIEAANELSSALARLLVVVERYPELKSDQSFLRLQDELAGTENRLAVARQRYNDAVRAYNTTRRRFPTNLIAGIFSLEEADYFVAPESAKQAPTVAF